ncbi:unnamed protein product [Moneuplotes crassus]|uniref:Uncharacterized protein n=1 Tax=Euplotes crassus TaxID=5936 RepID=A0AAD1Y9W4_EUPCR|nr:unnamed protein product [Moneuplotes crassus]
MNEKLFYKTSFGKQKVSLGEPTHKVRNIHCKEGPRIPDLSRRMQQLQRYHSSRQQNRLTIDQYNNHMPTETIYTPLHQYNQSLMQSTKHKVPKTARSSIQGGCKKSKKKRRSSNCSINRNNKLAQEIKKSKLKKKIKSRQSFDREPKSKSMKFFKRRIFRAWVKYVRNRRMSLSLCSTLRNEYKRRHHSSAQGFNLPNHQALSKIETQCFYPTSSQTSFRNPMPVPTSLTCRNANQSAKTPYLTHIVSKSSRPNSPQSEEALAQSIKTRCLKESSLKIAKIALKGCLKRLKRKEMADSWRIWRDFCRKCRRLRGVVKRRWRMEKIRALSIWKEGLFLANMVHAQKVMDGLPLKVEKNVLYDVGGEIQDILEKNYVYKDQGSIVYTRFDKMLRIIIDRVKEIEDGGVTNTDLFNSTRSNWFSSQISNSKSFQRKLVFESNVKKYIDKSVTPTQNDISSFIKIKAPQDRKNIKRIQTNSSRNEVAKLKVSDPVKFKNLYTPTESKNSGPLTLSSLDYLKCYEKAPHEVKKPQKPGITKNNRDITPPPMRDIETDQTISLFNTNPIPSSNGQKPTLSPSTQGILTPRDQNRPPKYQTWGSPSNCDQTTERVYAMLQLNQNLIQKYNSIRSPSTETPTDQPRRIKAADFHPSNRPPCPPRSPLTKRSMGEDKENTGRDTTELSPIDFCVEGTSGCGRIERDLRGRCG